MRGHHGWREALDEARRSAVILRDTRGTRAIGFKARLVLLDSNLLALINDIGRRREELGRPELLWIDQEIAAIESMVPPLARVIEREKKQCLAAISEFEAQGSARRAEPLEEVEPAEGTEAVDPDYHSHPGILRSQQAARDARRAEVPAGPARTVRYAGDRHAIADEFRQAAVPVWDEAIAIARRPYPAAAADWKLWNQRVRNFTPRRTPATVEDERAAERSRDLLRNAFPDLTDVLAKYNETVARLHGTQVLVQLRAKTIEQGRWPASLRELEPDLPRDPFTERAFRYQVSDDGVLLYSAGSDGRDDGGDERRDLLICTPRTAR